MAFRYRRLVVDVAMKFEKLPRHRRRCRPYDAGSVELNYLMNSACESQNSKIEMKTFESNESKTETRKI